MCTTQVCTVASGQVSRIDSGSPLSPSQQTISASCRPRLRSSVSIVAHCLAPSPPAGPEPQAEHVALAVEVDADRDVDRPVGDLRAAHLDHQAVDQQHRVERVERPALPGDHLVDDLVGDLRDRLPRDLGPVDLEQVLLDVPGRQPLRVQRDHVARQAHPGAAGTSAPSTGSNVPCRSRGTRRSTSPISVVTVLS